MAVADLDCLQDLGSGPQHEYELQVNTIKEVKQRLVELWKSSNTTFERKGCIFVFLCFFQVIVQNHYLCEVEK